MQKHAPERVDEYLESRGEQAQRSTRLGVLDCNWDTVRVFVLLSSDWLRAGLSGTFLGIPTPAVQSVLTITGLTLSDQDFEDLKLMEVIAKPILNQALQKR